MPRVALRPTQSWRVSSGIVTGAAVAVALAFVPVRGAERGKAGGKSDHSGIPQVKFINERMAAGWADARLKPSEPATDAEWCRRVHLDVIGRIPTVEELQKFVGDQGSNKRLELVDRLLGDEYVDEYARNWTDIWTTILIGRDVDNEMVSRPGMRQWLRRSLSKNIPYDRFMEELVTATGATKSDKDADQFNGAANFLSGKLQEGGVQATVKTAQIFLGLQVQCTQCHTHPIDSSKRQNQFWEMNAFFRQTRALRRFGGGRQIQWIELVDEDFPGEGRAAPQAQPPHDEAEIYYDDRNGTKKVAFPVFVDGTAISKSGLLPGELPNGGKFGVHRRKELAALIKASPLLPKAIVNRMWAHFLGYGFTKPIDDLGEHNAASHPELLDGLAERFREDSFDLKRLIRWIVLSSPYSLSSKATKANQGDDPSLGEQPKFTHFYLRQMRAEELYESLLTATQANQAQGADEAAAEKDKWLSQFVIAFGTDEGDDATTFNGSIPQVLMMFNGDLIKAAIKPQQGGFLNVVAAGNLSYEAKVDLLYQASLARKPQGREVTAAKAMLMARKGDVLSTLQDVWWAVLNSNEFILNH